MDVMDAIELRKALEKREKEKRSGDKETTKPECSCGNCMLSIITVEDILAASAKPKEGSVRCCDECGEGHCCDGREEEPRFVGIDYTRD